MESNQSLKGRSDKKENCYSMTLANQKDIPDQLNPLPLAVDEGVNQIKDASAAGGIHVKSVYKRYTFDFFKEEGG